MMNEEMNDEKAADINDGLTITYSQAHDALRQVMKGLKISRAASSKILANFRHKLLIPKVGKVADMVARIQSPDFKYHGYRFVVVPLSVQLSDGRNICMALPEDKPVFYQLYHPEEAASLEEALEKLVVSIDTYTESLEKEEST